MLLLRVLGATWRVRITGDSVWRSARARGTPTLLSLWHGDLLPITWAHRNQGIVVVVSEHRDGEIIAQALERLGCRTTRGSSTRGGSRALLGLIRALQHGDVAAVTPDGPRGPRHSVQPGVLAAARKAGAAVVGIGVAASREWRLRSWDQFAIPKPFARVHVAYADAFTVDAGATDIAAESPRITAAMETAHARAREALSRG
jgi:hypothetical protein